MDNQPINLYYLITLFILTILCSIFIIYLNRYTGNKYIDNFDGVQKFHSLPTPRLGGVAIFISFLISILSKLYDLIIILLQIISK